MLFASVKTTFCTADCENGVEAPSPAASAGIEQDHQHRRRLRRRCDIGRDRGVPGRRFSQHGDRIGREAQGIRLPAD
jgi:hypothetical protein